MFSFTSNVFFVGFVDAAIATAFFFAGYYSKKFDLVDKVAQLITVLKTPA